MNLKTIRFANTDLYIIREKLVRKNLSLDACIEDLLAALKALGQGIANNRPRIRLESQQRDIAWLHTLRGGWKEKGIAGGKDYTSKGFETPAMWVTVVDTTTGLPIAFIEADYLSRMRTATVTAIATALLAPPDPTCLTHFGAGKTSELLVEAVLKVRPSIQRVFLVRRNQTKETPSWLMHLPNQVKGELVDTEKALKEGDLITTATNSKEPIIPIGAKIKAHHLNLVGSNHILRREIHDDLAKRCLLPDSYLVVEDYEQAKIEAGDFASSPNSSYLDGKTIPTLAQLLVDDAEKLKAKGAKLTAFKSVGIGLMDLAVAYGVLRRLGVLHNRPYPQQ